MPGTGLVIVNDGAVKPPAGATCTSATSWLPGGVIVHRYDTGRSVSVSWDALPLTAMVTPTPPARHCTFAGASMTASGGDWKKKPYVLKWHSFTWYVRATGSYLLYGPVPYGGRHVSSASTLGEASSQEAT